MKILPVPYFRQEQDHYCGPAVLQMVFSYYGILAQQNNLAHLLHTSVLHGTKEELLVSAPWEYQFTSIAQQYASIENIKHYLNQNVPVIVSMLEPEADEGHFVVIVGHNGKFLTYHDPSERPHLNIPQDIFNKRWECGFSHYKQWLLAIQQPAHTMSATLRAQTAHI